MTEGWSSGGRKSWQQQSSLEDPIYPGDHRQPQGRVQTWNVPGIKIDVRLTY